MRGGNRWRRDPRDCPLVVVEAQEFGVRWNGALGQQGLEDRLGVELVGDGDQYGATVGREKREALVHRPGQAASVQADAVKNLNYRWSLGRAVSQVNMHHERLAGSDFSGQLTSCHGGQFGGDPHHHAVRNN